MCLELSGPLYRKRLAFSSKLSKSGPDNSKLRIVGASEWELYNITADWTEKRNLMGDPSVRAAQAAIVARMAYWTKESAHVLSQNTDRWDPAGDARANPMLNKEKAWLPWCPDSGCTAAPPPPQA